MAEWILKDNVTIDGVFKKLDMSSTYLIKLRAPIKDNSMFTDPYEILIQSTRLHEQLSELVEEKRERCYFAYGMTDIDFYKLKDKFAITDSPSPGHNVQLILADGEMERLVNSLHHESKERGGSIKMKKK